MIAERIVEWLAQPGRQLDEELRQASAERRAKRYAKQTLSDRTDKVGRMSATTLTWECALRAWHTYHGTPSGKLTSMQLLGMLIGDEVEADLLEISQNAGLPILDPQKYLLAERDGISFPVVSDGRLDGRTNVEVKKCKAWKLKKHADGERIDDFVGWLTQASLEIEAWRQNGFPEMAETEFVLFEADTPAILSVRVPYDGARVDKAFERARLARETNPPPIPKKLWPRQRRDGSFLLVKPCTFCSFRTACHPLAVPVRGWEGRTDWVVPAREKGTEAA